MDAQIIPERTEEKQRSTQTPVTLLARMAVDAILEKKGRDILVMEVSEVSGVADYFIITTADSDLQVRAIVDSVRIHIKDEFKERPWHVEGTDHHQWVVIDYVDLVVHVFLPEKREFYALDRLWGDAPQEQVPDTGSGESVVLLASE